MGEDLKPLPCPFCGYDKPKVQSNGIGDFYVICTGDDGEDWCEASSSDRSCESRKHALDRWNRRFLPSPPKGEECWGWEFQPDRVMPLLRDQVRKIGMHWRIWRDRNLKNPYSKTR